MSADETVGNYLDPATGIVRPTDAITQVRRQAHERGLRTVIVSDDNRLVGIIRWRDIERTRIIPESTLARDIMLANFPALEASMPASAARSNLETMQLDRLPVVNERGLLIGVVTCDALKDTAAMDKEHDDQSQHMPSAHVHPRRAFTIRPGMDVYSSDGSCLGLVNRMFLEQGVVVGFLVAHSGEDLRRKQLSFDVVDHLEGETIFLSITRDAFRDLPDVASNEC